MSWASIDAFRATAGAAVQASHRRSPSGQTRREIGRHLPSSPLASGGERQARQPRGDLRTVPTGTTPQPRAGQRETRRPRSGQRQVPIYIGRLRFSPSPPKQKALRSLLSLAVTGRSIIPHSACRLQPHRIDPAMGSRYEVEVTVGSARDLKNVNWRNGDLKPYAVLWVDSGAKVTTRVDLDNGENPVWDEKLLVPLPPSSRLDDAVLYIDVVHANAAEGVKPLVGSARLPLRDVLDDAGIGGKASRNLRLKRPSGRPHGRLDVRVAVKEPSRRGSSSCKNECNLKIKT
ncbi:hypothetical protein BS78_K093800 [Paspalum vaginatum]|uniref:C2 domain-containing protein n=1 Tax=Paspalum vaginatum TaxID=158149 RepID=A0A9W7X937_9POAL|nr:hypothetical protein BS78_K093800 [Paspalum vaginatum]